MQLNELLRKGETVKSQGIIWLGLKMEYLQTEWSMS